VSPGFFVCKRVDLHILCPSGNSTSDYAGKISRIDAACPHLDAVCRNGCPGAVYCVRNIACMFIFYGTEHFISSQRVAAACMPVTCQWATIYGNLSACQFAPSHREFLASMSLEQFTTIDKVMSFAHVGETLPAGVQVIMPARFRVNSALKSLNVSATHVWENYNIDGVILSACSEKTLPAGI
jgi:hypothetical protein